MRLLAAQTNIQQQFKLGEKARFEIDQKTQTIQEHAENISKLVDDLSLQTVLSGDYCAQVRHTTKELDRCQAQKRKVVLEFTTRIKMIEE